MATFKSLKPYRTLPRRILIRVAMQPIVQKMLVPFGHDLKPERWIFVIGCYNSGTTLLASVLRKHPQISGLPNEGAFLSDSLPYPEQKGWPRMWYKCVDHVSIDENMHNGESRARRIKKQWSLWYPKGSINLVEKTISNAARLPYLNKYFKPAYFIYIVRNGYAVVKGIQRKANLGRWNNPENIETYPIEMCAQQWVETDDIVQRDRNKVDKLLTISYESFTEHPKETMVKITEFLGIQPMPEEVLHKGWSIHEFSSQIQNMNNSSFKYLSSEDIVKIEKVAGEKLQQYGYERPIVKQNGKN